MSTERASPADLRRVNAKSRRGFICDGVGIVKIGGIGEEIAGRMIAESPDIAQRATTDTRGDRAQKRRPKHKRSRQPKPQQTQQPAPRRWAPRNHPRSAAATRPASMEAVGRTAEPARGEEFAVNDEEFPALPGAVPTFGAAATAGASSRQPVLNYRESVEIAVQEELLRKYSRTLGSRPPPAPVPPVSAETPEEPRKFDYPTLKLRFKTTTQAAERVRAILPRFVPPQPVVPTETDDGDDHGDDDDGGADAKRNSKTADSTWHNFLRPRQIVMHTMRDHVRQRRLERFDARQQSRDAAIPNQHHSPSPTASTCAADVFTLIEQGDTNALYNLLSTSGLSRNMHHGAHRMEPVHFACELQRAECLELLLQKSPTAVNAVDRKKRTPLHIACATGDLECVQILLKYGADVDCKDKSAETPLHKAARRGSKEVVLQLCERENLAVNRRNKRQQTPLLVAAEEGHAYVVKALLRCGAIFSGRTTDGLDVCAMAARSGDLKLLEFLVMDQHAAPAGQSLIDDLPNYSSAMHEAASAGHVECVEFLHVVSPGDLDTRSRRHGKALYTPLMCAAMGNHVDIISYLLSAGADPCVVTADGDTALMLAVSCGHVEAVSVLLVDAPRTGAPRFADDSVLEHALRLRSRRALECVPLLLANHATFSRKQLALLELEASPGHEKEFQASMYPRLSTDIFDVIESLRTSDTGDVVLEAEGVRFRAHKWLLAARSQAFAAMFEDPMQARLSGDVRFAGHNAATVRLFLRYLYSASPDFLGTASSQELIELLYFAHEFTCLRLQRICEHQLGRRIDPKNRPTYLELASALSLPVLLYYCRRFTPAHVSHPWMDHQLTDGTGYLSSSTLASWISCVLEDDQWSAPTFQKFMRSKLADSRPTNVLIDPNNLQSSKPLEQLLLDPTSQKAFAIHANHNEQAESLMPNDIALLRDLHHAVASGRCCDCVMRCNDGNTELPAHKSLLTARATKLAAMVHFREAQDASAAETLVLDFGASISANMLRLLHFFIYHGFLPGELSDEDLVSLAFCADEYMIGSLKASCETLLSRRVRIDNAVPMYFVAETLDMVLLIRHASMAILTAFPQVSRWLAQQDTSSWQYPVRSQGDLDALCAHILAMLLGVE